MVGIEDALRDSGPEKFVKSRARRKKPWAWLVWPALLIYAYTFWLMLEITLQYRTLSPDAAFLAIKQDYVPMLHYRIAFFVHVFSAIFVLLAGFTQFSKRMRIKHKALHRRAGWLYAGVTLLLAGPSGLVIGLYANGGLGSRIAFCLLASLWMLFTALAIVTIVKGKVRAHEKWMIRSFSLALSALTLRAWKLLIVVMFQPKPMDVYRIVAWLGWVLNLAIAEAWIYYQFRPQARRTSAPDVSETAQPQIL